MAFDRCTVRDHFWSSEPDLETAGRNFASEDKVEKMAANASTQKHGNTSGDHIVYLPTSEKETSPALEDKIAGQGSQKDLQKEIEGVETGSTVSTKIQTLLNNKEIDEDKIDQS